MRGVIAIPAEQKPCPWCGGQPVFREIRYEGTGASGMEAPDLMIGCATDRFWFPQVRTVTWGGPGKGTTDRQVEAEEELLVIWNDRSERGEG